MIVSVSRRTDIPALYADWFWERLREGFALARNPFNPRQIRKIPLGANEVDGFVFWSKNPAPMLPHLHRLSGYPFYFQFTLNPYGSDAEPGVPPLSARAETLRVLSDAVGSERVVWRYDPVLLSPAYPINWHIDQFQSLCARFSDAVGAVSFSFVDSYRKNKNALLRLGIQEIPSEGKRALARAFVSIAETAKIPIRACCEPQLEGMGIETSRCIDADRLSRIAGHPIPSKRDSSQRPGCGCAQSADIGAYDGCLHACAYCYANRGSDFARTRFVSQNPLSPLLFGDLREAP